MAKGWYVVHTYSGFENKVHRHLARLIESPRMQNHLFDAKVPAEDVLEVGKDGRKKVTSRKFLPGYILVEMDLEGEAWMDVCAAVRQIQGVTGFVGADRNSKPQPITSDEARDLLQKAGEIKSDRTLRPKQSFVIGESVRIIDGPFDSFTGSVEEINEEKAKLRVMVGIFGRSTPVELDFMQVEKV